LARRGRASLSQRRLSPRPRRTPFPRVHRAELPVRPRACSVLPQLRREARVSVAGARPEARVCPENGAGPCPRLPFSLGRALRLAGPFPGASGAVGAGKRGCLLARPRGLPSRASPLGLQGFRYKNRLRERLASLCLPRFPGLRLCPVGRPACPCRSGTSP